MATRRPLRNGFHHAPPLSFGHFPRERGKSDGFATVLRAREALPQSSSLAFEYEVGDALADDH